jgi:hypothetical protein
MPAAGRRADANESIMPSNLLVDKTALGVGGPKSSIDLAGNVEKPVNRTASEFYFQRSQLSAVAGACDT